MPVVLPGLARVMLPGIMPVILPELEQVSRIIGNRTYRGDLLILLKDGHQAGYQIRAGNGIAI